MAKKSKVSGISVECGHDLWKSGTEYVEEVHFHRKNVPTNHSYMMKRSDHDRLKKILDTADHHSMLFGAENILLQYHYYRGFLDNKWVVYFLKYTSRLYWGTLWLMMLYILYTRYFVGE